jgi:MerC mercury resistance protein
MQSFERPCESCYDVSSLYTALVGCLLFNQGEKCVPGFGRILDRFAIGLSSLCLVHCLATPLLLLILPAASLTFAFPDSFHLWMLLTAIPVSVLALLAGHRHHGLTLPTLLAFTGIGLLGYGAMFVATRNLELVFTALGALFLAGAHIWNARLTGASVSV